MNIDVQKEMAEIKGLGHTTKGFDEMSISQRGMIAQPNSMEEWALFYASLGWPVFPLIPRQKTPITDNGLNDATTDAATIREWWAKWPNANIGVATGHVFDVLDFDLNLSGNKGGVPHPEIWEQYKDAIGKTPVVRTRNGYHVYYIPTKGGNRTQIGPETGEFAKNGKAKKACDWRGVGGYVLLPPSVFEGGSGNYTWLVSPDESPFSEAPAVVKSWLERKKKAPTKSQKAKALPFEKGASDAQKLAWLRGAMDGMESDLAGAVEGERNDMLNKVAYRMYGVLNGSVGQLAEASQLEQVVHDAALNIGLDEEEVVRTMESAKKGAESYVIEPEFKTRESKPKITITHDSDDAFESPIPDLAPDGDDELKWDKLQGAAEMTEVLNKIGFSGYYNALANRTVYMIDGNEVEISDNGQLVAHIVSRISKAGYVIGTGNQTLSSLFNLMDGICHKTPRNPVSEYLDALPVMSNKADAYAVWQELATLGGYNDAKYAGIILAEFVAVEFNRWMSPAKTRGQHWAVLLRGGQRGGKSALFRKLTEGITDSTLFVEITEASDDRVVVEKGQGNMFAEISEGCLMNKRDEASMKALLSMTEYSGRFAYGRKAKKITVSWSYVITTNDAFLLKDPTGASRYACLEFTPEVNRMTPAERSNTVAKRLLDYVEKNRATLWSAAKTIAQDQGTSLEDISERHEGLADWLEAGREANRCVSRDEDFLVEFLDQCKTNKKRYFKTSEAENYVLRMRDETKDVRRADIRKTITSIMQRYTEWVFKSTLRENGVRIAQRVYVYEGKTTTESKQSSNKDPLGYDENIPWV